MSFCPIKWDLFVWNKSLTCEKTSRWLWTLSVSFVYVCSKHFEMLYWNSARFHNIQIFIFHLLRSVLASSYNWCLVAPCVCAFWASMRNYTHFCDSAKGKFSKPHVFQFTKSRKVVQENSKGRSSPVPFFSYVVTGRRLPSGNIGKVNGCIIWDL